MIVFTQISKWLYVGLDSRQENTKMSINLLSRCYWRIGF